jgi:O-antigen ligase
VGGAAALGVSFSRSGWVGGWLALVVVAALAWWWARRRAALALGVVLLLLGGAGALLVAGGAEVPGLPAAYGERLASLGGGGALFGDRAGEWRRGLDAIAASPLVGRSDAPNCYNLLLQIAARSGLPAAACLLALVVAVAARMLAVGGAQRAAAPANAVLVAGCLGGLVGLLATGIGESSLGLRVVPVALTLLGVGAGLGAARPGEPKSP